MAGRWGGLHECSGAIHVHSTDSDGHWPLPGIMRAADRAGLDFLALTDHDTLAARSHEGWWGSVLLVVGHEVTPDKEHYLAFGLDTVVPPVLGESDRYMAEVTARGGFGFIAHPFDRGNPRVHVPSYEWRPALTWAEETENPPPAGAFAGIEVWNYYSEWLGSQRTVPGALRALAMPKVYSPGPAPLGLALWDAVGRTRRVAGIGGLDAHGADGSFPWRRIRVMTYDFAFRALRTNVLLDRPLSPPAKKGAAPSGAAEAGSGKGGADDIRAVLEALRQGRALLVDAGQGPAKGARFWAAPAGAAGAAAGGATDAVDAADVTHSSRALPGDEVRADSPLLRDGRPLELNFTVPAPARLVILRDGRPLAEGFGRALRAMTPGPGVYRAEAHRWRARWRPWILTNPIYVRGGETA